jgi:Ca2+-transporting ATPase
VGGALLFQLAVIYIPFFNSLFRIEALSMEELAYCFLFSAMVFHAVEAEKWVRQKLYPLPH